MRWTLAVALAAMLWPTVTKARCRAFSVDFHPPRGTRAMPTNPQILVVVSRHRRDAVAKLLDGAMLVSRRKGRVPLKVERLPQSDHSFENTYIVLRPQRELAPWTVYRLVLQRQKTDPQLRFQHRTLRRYQFGTGRSADTVAPGKVSLGKARHHFRALGCGPSNAIHVEVTLPKDDRTPTKRLLTVARVDEQAKDGSKRAFDLTLPPLHTKLLAIGHGMCQGNYKLRAGATYQIRLQAMDWAGNRGPLSQAVTISLPAKNP